MSDWIYINKIFDSKEQTPNQSQAKVETASEQSATIQTAQERQKSNLEEIVSLNPDQYFKLSNGKEITSMLDLVESLRNMDDNDVEPYTKMKTEAYIEVQGHKIWTSDRKAHGNITGISLPIFSPIPPGNGQEQVRCAYF